MSMTRRHLLRRTLGVVGLVVALYAGYLGVTLILALGNPGYGVSMAARGAEWGRQHGLGGVVTWAETEWYRLNPPTTGGTPRPGSLGPSGPTSTLAPSPQHLASPTRIAVTNPLPGEGIWHPVGRPGPGGYPAIYQAFVRPDSVHTSYVVGLAWMDPTLLTARLYSGSTIPGGGPYRYSAPIAVDLRNSLAAAFNAGFRMSDARGGYYTDGRTVIPLVNGAASAVIYRNGVLTVGAWGRDVHMSPNVVAVRQNLDLLVDNGKSVSGLSRSDNIKWGATLGGSAYVWRSALGVTADGALIYAGGPALSIVDLANVMVRAGAVRAMELDINPDWVQYSIFGGQGAGVTGRKLLSSMNGDPSRYFASWWTRDFFTMSVRPTHLNWSASS